MFLSKQFGCYAFICLLDITIKVIPLIQRENGSLVAAAYIHWMSADQPCIYIFFI
ncbi:hypothetical protein ES319_D12G296600v1 [Gossypium barbadense]|uniref:Uncharacterized protein n=3 Tax=Gossypium TaxID=3633 RepID=A0A5J5P4R5_GOSBA|nr:hypothetical protein ES319_D12G296600v1 [Gossypium barbadense]TYG43124.1 hypothetical protein ES288_D12G312200v1 [Gossypium darwinii]TYH41385.1 hypothetical protein ES332_D12G313300v1 [Gossypium tomentosum]